jgi:Anti-sigma factor NepR
MSKSDGNREPPVADAASTTPSEPIPPRSLPSVADNRPAQGAAAALDIQSYIGSQLRAVYDDVVKQPIPDRFLELMRQLD